MTRRQILTYSTALLIMLVGTNRAAVAVTYLIPSDTSIGTWDPLSRRYTLTKNVSGKILFLEDDLTLDGDGFTVSGGSVEALDKTGIVIKNIDIHTTGSSGYGILLYNCDNCTVTSNTISNKTYGISVFAGSDNCTISGNTVSGSDAVGIEVWESDNCTITGNTVSGSSIAALQFFGACDFTVTGNTITDNTYTFQIFPSPDSPSTGGQIYNNNFIGNLHQWGTVVPLMCDFYLPAPVGGNYWSNHTGPDADGDGFVDVPYELDNLPWTVQDGWLIPTVADILDFIYVSVEDETLLGDGPAKSAEKRLSALVNMLEEAQRLIEEEFIEEACEQLEDAYLRTDGESRPPDFVAGPAASELAALIQCLMDSM